MRRIPLVLLLLLLTACTPPLPASDMMPMTQVYSQIPVNKKIEGKVKLGTVTVFDGAKSGYTPVTVEAYSEALQNALLTANFAVRGDQQGKYILEAHLLGLDVPTLGFSMTASATAHYILRKADTDDIVMDKTISLPYTAEFGEAFNGTVRARLAVAKAIRENITQMIRFLALQK